MLGKFDGKEMLMVYLSVFWGEEKEEKEIFIAKIICRQIKKYNLETELEHCKSIDTTNSQKLFLTSLSRDSDNPNQNVSNCAFYSRLGSELRFDRNIILFTRNENV